ncbi:MAG TPA: asparagine synthase (glutamine-hydrolyzing) [Pyrinomonadaceae bacterium]|jgi:asparagine synthase (glutamine-hydrolysing)|nr:asparagine synthase (glutamine-hydrolyzing) [Pyrinomonadaceae bacterium]
MCGFAGYINLRAQGRVDEEVLPRMVRTLVHRGPDSSGFFKDDELKMGFRRLSIIDLAGGDQPLFNEDHSVVLLCNGEIFNYQELKKEVTGKGHTFRTDSDVEVLLHLYEEDGIGFLNKLNGQFAFVLYDRREKRLFLARDHFGINPLYYTVADGVLIFASEIKAILEHPQVRREVDLTGLDQILSFPGLVSPRTMFKGIESLKSGHYIEIKNGDIRTAEYWDLDYPQQDELPYDRPEAYYRDGLKQRLAQAVSYRLQADVPVGFYLSGGLDSSLIAALIEQVSPGNHRHSFSIGFNDKAMCETKYQRLMAEHVASVHHEIIFDWPEISERLKTMLYHCESPVKETYNTCSMALSEAAKANGITVILTGEGADELFAGYVGYRFDRFRARNAKSYDLETILEDELREKLWGDKDFFYEKEHYAFNELKAALYSPQLAERFDEFDCLKFPLVNQERLRGRHYIHQRSYLDFKLRLSDHLISDHGDRMALANSVEARYPFLDIDVATFATQIPPHLKLNEYTEKYLLKRVAEDFLPPEVINREKYGFIAPGSPYLLRQNIEWVNDTLSFERIKRQGYFNPEVIERLKAQYSAPGFKLNFPFDDDLLIVVLTFGIFKDIFNLPDLN